MSKIEKIDPNVKAASSQKEGLTYYNIRNSPFQIYGLYQPEKEGVFRRIPYETATAVSEGIAMIHTAPTGGRIRFQTDSKIVSLKAIYKSSCIMSIMAITGSCCFDLYADGHFMNSFRIATTSSEPNIGSFDFSNGYDGFIPFPDRKMRDIIIHFPLYSEVSDVWIGLKEDATLLPGKEYKHTLPVVFYGSSITHGGCASRPGNSYPALLSRWLDTDIINLGFAGNALGETEMAQYIADLPMSVFVYDYDYNTPNAEHLEKTHDAMYQIIREKNPDLPILILTRPVRHAPDDKRVSVIQQTYQKAKDRGEPVYFISGQQMFNLIDPEMFNTDGVHPNDFGFYCMAQEVKKILEGLL